MFESLVASIQPMLQNQFFSGGVLLGALAALSVYFKKLPTIVFRFIERRMVFSMEVDKSSGPEIFDLTQLWLANNEWLKWKRQSMMIESKFGDKKITSVYNSTLDDDNENSGENTYSRGYMVTPSPGTYIIRDLGRFIFVTISRNKEQNSFYSSPVFHEKLIVRFIAFDKKKAHKDWIQFILTKQQNIERDNNNFVKISKGSLNGWDPQVLKDKRPIESLVFKDGFIEDVLTDMKKFFSSSVKYARLGIPFRRGYLLYGPPGNGKTSLVFSLAGYFNKRVHVINLATVTDESLMSLVSSVKSGAFILMEDIDCVDSSKSRKTTEETEETAEQSATHKKNKSSDAKLSMSGLLNAMDGLLAPERGTVFFMTTNFKDKLDEAVIRPGRADVHFLVDNATKKQASDLFLRFFGNEQKIANEFGEIVGDGMFSMASVQGCLLASRHVNEVLEIAKNTLQHSGRELSK